MIGAAFEALTTADAAVEEELQFGLGLQGLGIMTPEATQVTALEKDRRTDAGTIVDGETLDVGHITLHSIHLIRERLRVTGARLCPANKNGQPLAGASPFRL
jgi:hypothetical protein